MLLSSMVLKALIKGSSKSLVEPKKLPRTWLKRTPAQLANDRQIRAERCAKLKRERAHRANQRKSKIKD